MHEGQTRFWDTAKGYKAETIEGSRLWAIEGGGSPRRYFLHGSGIITRLRPKRGVQYRVDKQLEPIEINGFKWFEKLRHKFSFGVSRIIDRRVIAGLTNVTKKAPKSIAQGRAGRRDMATERMSRDELLAFVRQLPEKTPIANTLAQGHSSKQSWINWLSNYPEFGDHSLRAQRDAIK